MNSRIIGDKNTFAIGYTFFDDTRETELSMFVDGRNLLEYINIMLPVFLWSLIS